MLAARAIYSQRASLQAPVSLTLSSTHVYWCYDSLNSSHWLQEPFIVSTAFYELVLATST